MSIIITVSRMGVLSASFWLVSCSDSQPLQWPPRLPSGQTVVSDTSADFLRAPETIRPGIEIAVTPPTIDFVYYPGQTRKGGPWSVWGDGSVADGKYYSAIGDHNGPNGRTLVYEYDPDIKRLRLLVDINEVLDVPEDHYTPGKIHGRIEVGEDGRVYFGTMAGKMETATAANHYRGDWILGHDVMSGKTEIVATAPVPMESISTSVLDAERGIFYGGTQQSNIFFAYDLNKRELIYSGSRGPARYMIFSKSTGRVYYAQGVGGQLFRFDPKSKQGPVAIDASLGLRAATEETGEGLAYTVSHRPDATLWEFDTKSEKARRLGDARVGSQEYITSLDIDPTGRYLYYVPGAIGGSDQDGSAVVQFDIFTGRKKVIAFLHPFYWEKYGFAPSGTYSSAISPKGDKLYISWHGRRAGKGKIGEYGFDTCALTVVHIPKAERLWRDQ